MADPLLEVKDLTIQYETRSTPLTAVSNASFSIDNNQYLGLVGESGCGKSTLAKAIMGVLDENGKVVSGEVRYKGEEIQHLSDKELSEKIRWSEIAFVPQSSMNSLDPLERISKQAVEIARTHVDMSKREVKEELGRLFEIMGLSRDRMTDYPHQFSGGMRQRATIALSLLLDPSLLIADEPTTALDVIMQDQVFQHLASVKELDTSMMLITHDISVVFESCDKIVVMHGGQVAETGSVTDIYDEPRHPYSILLQRAFPDIRHPNRELEQIEGRPTQQFGSVDHCTFKERCPLAVEECHQHAPSLKQVNENGDQMAACFRMDDSPELHTDKQETAEEQIR